MKSRRVLLLVTDLQIGGTPTVVRELAIRLRSSDVEVEVACLSGWGPVADQLRDLSIEVTAMDCKSSLQFTRAAHGLIRLIYERNYDTVLSFLVHANAVAAVAYRSCRGVRFFQSIQTSQTQPRWHWLMQSVAQRAARAVVVPSESAARVATELAHVPREKIVVIPNAVDADAFERSHAFDTRPFPVGFVGRLDPVKRVPLLVREFARVSDAHLHIFGDGSARSEIADEIARLNLQSRVTLHGAIAKPQAAMSQIGLLVLPSRAEGFGLVLIEAMAAGVPVIGANVAGIRDVVRNGDTGLLVDVERDGELANAIVRVIGDKPLRDHFIVNGLRAVRENYSWDTVLAAYRSILEIAR